MNVYEVTVNSNNKVQNQRFSVDFCTVSVYSRRKLNIFKGKTVEKQ